MFSLSDLITLELSREQRAFSSQHTLPFLCTLSHLMAAQLLNAQDQREVPSQGHGQSEVLRPALFFSHCCSYVAWGAAAITEFSKPALQLDEPSLV